MKKWLYEPFHIKYLWKIKSFLSQNNHFKIILGFSCWWWRFDKCIERYQNNFRRCATKIENCWRDRDQDHNCSWRISSCSYQRKYFVFLNYWDELGKCYVPNFFETIFGTFWSIHGEVSSELYVDRFEVHSQDYFRPYIQALNSGNYTLTNIWVVYCCVEYIELTIFPRPQISIASLKDQPISVALTGNPAFDNTTT